MVFHYFDENHVAELPCYLGTLLKVRRLKVIYISKVMTLAICSNYLRIITLSTYTAALFSFSTLSCFIYYPVIFLKKKT